MLFPKNARNKLDFSCLSAAALMNLLKKQRDSFGLSLFNDKVQEHIKPRSSNTHYKLLISKLEKQLGHQEESRGSHVSDALHQIAESIHKRSLVIIFSDMFDTQNPDEIFAALQHLRHNKHEVVLFHVTDEKHEKEFAFQNRPYRFIDMETGEEIKINPNDVRTDYASALKKFYNQLKLKCGQYNIDLVQADINKGFKEVLMPFLVKRSKLH